MNSYQHNKTSLLQVNIAKMDTIIDYMHTMDYISYGLVVLPIAAILLCGYFLIGRNKNDTMQRHCSKVNHTNNRRLQQQQKDSNNSHHHQHHHHQHHRGAQKCDSSDSGLSTTNEQSSNAHTTTHTQHHHHNNNNGKQRKTPRSCTKQMSSCGGGGGGANGQKRSNSNNNNNNSSSNSNTNGQNNNGIKTTTTTTTTTKVGVWLDDSENMVYCYERTLISSCGEDNIMSLHNPKHRNSTSSEAAASDDLNSSSSNEDLTSAFRVAPKTDKKKPRNRQRRRQKCKMEPQQQQQQVGVDDVKDLQQTGGKQQNKLVNGPNNKQANSKGGATQLTNAKPNSNAKTTTSLNTNNNNNKTNKLTSNNNNTTLTTKKSSTKNSHFSRCSDLSSSSASSSSDSSLCGKRSSPSSSQMESCSSSSSSSSCSPHSSPTVTKRDNYKKIARAFNPQAKHFIRQNFGQHELVQRLRRYQLDPNLLRVYGYPVESAVHEGCIEIYKCLPKAFTHTHSAGGAKTATPATAPEVINTSDGLTLGNELWASRDSGQCSVDSTPPSMDSDSSEVGEDDASGATAFYTPDGSYQIFSQYDRSLKKQCVRCKRPFHVTDGGEYLSREECVFHWGKLYQMYTSTNGFAYQYSCCEGEEDSEGCTRNYLHVWTGAVVGINGPYTDYVHTRPRNHSATDETKVYALDCEMSFTGRGLEVTKISMVDHDGSIVYEHFVRPDAEVVDYNTRFSGVTEKDLSHSNSGVKTLAQVQRDLLQLVDADTILIGHALDNDLRALRIVHKTIIDTSIAFPHNSGFPYRRSLKHLTKLCLNRDIQCGNVAHSSYEDSRACLDLMLWKVRKDAIRSESEIERELNSRYVCL